MPRLPAEVPGQAFLRTARGDIPVFHAGTHEAVTQPISNMAFDPYYDNPRATCDLSFERYQDDPFADPLTDPFEDILEDVIQSHIRRNGANHDDVKSDCGPCCYESDIESDDESDDVSANNSSPAAGRINPAHDTNSHAYKVTLLNVPLQSAGFDEEAASRMDPAALAQRGAWFDKIRRDSDELVHQQQKKQTKQTKQMEGFSQSVKSLFYIKPCQNHDEGHVCTPRHRMRRMMRRWKRRANKTATKARDGFEKLVHKASKAAVNVKRAAVVASTATGDTLKSALSFSRKSYKNQVRAESRARAERRRRAHVAIRHCDIFTDDGAQDALELTDHDVVAIATEGDGINVGNETEAAPLLLI